MTSPHSNRVYISSVATCFGLNHSSNRSLQDKIPGIVHLYVKHLVFTFLSCVDPTVQNYPDNKMLVVSDKKVELSKTVLKTLSVYV